MKDVKIHIILFFPFSHFTPNKAMKSPMETEDDCGKPYLAEKQKEARRFPNPKFREKGLSVYHLRLTLAISIV